MDKIQSTLNYIKEINVCELKSYDKLYQKLSQLEIDLKEFQYEKQGYQNIQNDLVLFQLQLISCTSNNTADSILQKIESINRILNEKLPSTNNVQKKKILFKSNLKNYSKHTAKEVTKPSKTNDQLDKTIPSKIDEKIKKYRIKTQEFTGDEINPDFSELRKELEGLDDELLRQINQKIKGKKPDDFKKYYFECIFQNHQKLEPKIATDKDEETNYPSVHKLKQKFDIAGEEPKRNFNVVKNISKEGSPFKNINDHANTTLAVKEIKQGNIPSVYKLAQKFEGSEVTEYNSIRATISEIKRLTPFLGEDIEDDYKNKAVREKNTSKEEHLHTNKSNKDDEDNHTKTETNNYPMESEEIPSKLDENMDVNLKMCDKEEKVDKKEKSKIKKVLHEIKKELYKITANLDIMGCEESSEKLDAIQHILEATVVKLKFKNQIREKNGLIKQVKEIKDKLAKNNNVTQENSEEENKIQNEKSNIKKYLSEIQLEMNEVIANNHENPKLLLEGLEKKLISVYVNPEYDRLLKEKHRLAIILNEHKNKSFNYIKPSSHLINQLLEFKQEFNKICIKLDSKENDEYEKFMMVTFLKKLADNLGKFDIDPGFEKEINEAKTLMEQIKKAISFYQKNTKSKEDNAEHIDNPEEIYEDVLPSTYATLTEENSDLSIIMEEEMDNEECDVKENAKDHLRKVNILLGIDDEYEEDEKNLDWIENDSLNGDTDRMILNKSEETDV
ncbi:unnamed protein product [Brassicogethes aeneus]|uniref:Uncharacterized protein n=1 Tax=Brassicogethes aeneus TaxID=1431903 RepID=A0A9P0BK22_BRAAE|nr:unnamed protein product [Brassicogethes aeneus]